MTPVGLIHAVGRLLSAVVLVAAGIYVFVYLVRWEWNRALVAGLFLLAAEVFLLADVLLGRIGDLGRRVARAREEEQAQLLSAQLRASRPQGPGPFAWLRHDPTRVTVLLPMLIGAGVVLSALSYLVRQLARVSAVPAAEDGLARGLATIALPVEGLRPVGRSPAPAPRPTELDHARPLWNALTLAGVVVLITALVTAGVMLLLSVPEPADPDRRTQVDLVVERRNLAQPERDVALALWATCRTRIPEDVELESLRALDPEDPSRLRMVLSATPGETDRREFIGCLQDAVIERSWTSVTGFERLAAGTGSPGARSPGAGA